MLSYCAETYIHKELLLQYQEICWDKGVWNRRLRDEVWPNIRLEITSPED